MLHDAIGYYIAGVYNILLACLQMYLMDKSFARESYETTACYGSATPMSKALYPLAKFSKIVFICKNNLPYWC